MKPTLGCRLFSCDRLRAVVLVIELAIVFGLTTARADQPKRALSAQETKRLEGIAQEHVEAYLARDYQSALAYAEQWLRVQPDNMIPRRHVAHAKARILFGRGEAAEARGDKAAAAEAYAEAVKIYPRDSMEQDDFRSIALTALRRTLAGSPVGSPTLLGVGGDTSRQPPHFNRAACLDNNPGSTSRGPDTAQRSPTQVPSTGSAAPAPTASTGGGLPFATGNLSSPPVQKDWAGVGVYELEASIEFNVLDWVLFDPASNQLVLAGRRDPRFAGRRIPYLNHLAGLLDHPKAEMTLTWAPDSERRVDAFLRRMDNPAELAKLAREAGTIWDGKGGITESAKWLLPYMGLQPGPDGMYGYIERDDVNAALLATAGNVEGACVVLAARELKFFGQSPGDTRQFYFWEMIRSLGLKSELQSLVAQQRAGQMTEERYTYLTMRRVCERLDQIFGLEGAPVLRAFDNQMRVSRNNTLGMDTCFGEFDKHRRAIAERALDKVFGRVREVSIAIDGVSSLMGARPEVSPKFTNVDATSSLARLMFEADYLGKQLINLPEFDAQDIVGYRTEFAFNRENPGKRVGKNATQHLWFSVDGVDTALTKDGNGLEVRGARLRINVREYDSRGRDKPAIAGGYGDLLTSLYPQFAEKFQVLHELQEVAKLTAVAQWIRQRRPDFSLPREGRQRWTPPTRVPGVMYMTVALLESKTSANTVVSAVGGVSLSAPIQSARPQSDRAVTVASFDQSGTLRTWLFTKKVPAGWTGRGRLDDREVEAVALNLRAPLEAVVGPGKPAEEPKSTSVIKVGSVETATGAVTIRRRWGQTLAATPGVAFYDGDTVITGPNSRLRIQLRDETIFLVGPNSNFELDEFVYDAPEDDKLTARLTKGLLRIITGKAARRDISQYNLKLPVGILGPRGTDFETMTYDDESGYVKVYSGAVVLRNTKTGTESSVAANQIITFEATGSMTGPRPF